MPIRSTSPMVVVSNRLPFTVCKDEETGKYIRKISAGGLVTAVAPVVVESGGLWVGWPGIYSEDGETIEIPESDPSDRSPTAGLKTSQVISVDIKKEMFDKYYNGCCNACFWPLFHSMPDRALFEGDKWQAYKTVNEEFARLTVQAVRILKKQTPDCVPLVWLHDYHLMVAANHIRDACDEEGLAIKMAFFLHIPFPSWDIMRLFPWEDELLQGILGCDSIGFHINDYCLNFIDCCKRRLGCRTDRDNGLVEHINRTVEVHTLPISIPYERFVKLSEEAETVLDTKEKKFILGVDRLDYTKGLVHRLKAFELLLEKYPEYIEKVVFFQIAVPSRTDVVEYQDLKEELDQLIGSVNGKFSTPNWSPIRYMYGCIPQNQLASFYRDSAVAVVTPLRDGMNLVAKEFIACQTREPGVLMLSPFAGAAEFMKEAIIINPYETNEFADVLHRALSLSKDEAELRMIKLRNRERKHDVNYWFKSFLISVQCLEDENTKITPLSPLAEGDYDQFLSKYVTENSNLAILLDYDGTLSPLKSHPDLAVLPAETKKVLVRLAALPDVHLAIISGRSLKNIKEMVGIEGITYAGNHGLDILQPDGTIFSPAVPPDYTLRLSDMKVKLQEFCNHGAWIEDKGNVLTYHFVKVPKEKLSEILPGAKQVFADAGITVSHSHNAFEARPPINWNKGRAAIHILRTLFGVDWSDRVSTIFAGDDKTDEDAIQALQGMAITFRITRSQNVRTGALHRLPDTDAVMKMLKWIARRLEKREALLNAQSRESPLRQ